MRVTSSSLSSALLYPSSIAAAAALLPPREISLSSVSPFVAVVVVLSGSGPSSHDDRCYVVDIDHPRRNLSAASAVIAPSPERKEPVNQNASLIPSPLHSLCLSLSRACICGVPGSQNDTAAAAATEIQSHYYLSGWQGGKQRTQRGGGGGAISPPFVTGYTTEIKAGMEVVVQRGTFGKGNHPLCNEVSVVHWVEDERAEICCVRCTFDRCGLSLAPLQSLSIVS